MTIDEQAGITAVETARERMQQLKDLLESVYLDGVEAGRKLQKEDDEKELAYLRSTLESVLGSRLEEQT